MELVFDNLWLAWIVVSIVCLIIELNSGDLYFICFAIGAIVSMIFDLCGAPLSGPPSWFAFTISRNARVMPMR